MLSQININSYNNNISYTALPKKYKVVDEYLIRGPHPSPVDIIRLKKEGVNRIYDFRHKSIKGFKFLERLMCKITGINYERKGFSYLNGEYPELKDYDKIAKEVKENGKNGGKSLFHCNSGTHRTALMSAFYDITRGEDIEKVKNNPNYEKKVEETIKNQILNTKFFSRNRVDLETKNPIKRLQNGFNNRVQFATKKAYDLFIEMVMQKKC